MKIDLFYCIGVFIQVLLGTTGIVWADNLKQPNPNDGSFYIAPRMEVKIDGYLDEWQQKVPIHLNRADQVHYYEQDWGGPHDCSTRFWLAWNDSGLIVAALTKDDSITFPFSGHKSWANDCIQIAFDVLDDNAQDYYSIDDREFVITCIDSQATVYEYAYSEDRESGYKSYPCQVQVLQNLICYEVLIPWQELGITGSKAGKNIGMSLVAFDNDGQDTRGWLLWTAGVANKKFTLPFATVLLFDPQASFVQSIPTQTFLSENDSVIVWIYSRYSYRKYRITCRLHEKNETLLRQLIPLRGKQWTRYVIPPKFLKWGWLKLEVVSARSYQQFDIAIWSKMHITQQIAYLGQQVQALKSLKDVDPAANMLIRHWMDWLQAKFSSARTDFDFFNVMDQARQRIEKIPNFYMRQPVFYDYENRIVEQVYYSKTDESIYRYLVYLPAGFKRDNKYPLYLFLRDMGENEEESARKIGSLLAQLEIPVIGLFFGGNPEISLTWPLMTEVMNCLADVLKKYSIDTRRIYLAGEGTGGLAATLLAIRFPDQFAAITPIRTVIDSTIPGVNLKYTAVQMINDEERNSKSRQFISELENGLVDAVITEISNQEIEKSDKIYTQQYFDWLTSQRKELVPEHIDLQIRHLQPFQSFWLEISAQEDYQYDGYIQARLDSNRLIITTKNIALVTVVPDRLAPTAVYPLEVFVDQEKICTIKDNKSANTFYKKSRTWAIRREPSENLEKSPTVTGPLSAIFNRPVKYVYSTGHENESYNQMTRTLARLAGRRGSHHYLDHLILADTTISRHQVTANLIIFGNNDANLYLRKLASRLPFQSIDQGVKFGKSHYHAGGIGVLYVYPNPMNPNFLVLVGVAPDTIGLLNLQKVWDLNLNNDIFNYDYVIIKNGSFTERFHNWEDSGYFDHNWGTDGFNPLFNKGPKHWFPTLLVGADANQLSINSNWRGGGKGNYTWKTYFKMELKYQQKKYTWQNSIYCAFGQISIQENKHWRSPEKSNDIIDFDSVLRLTLERFIDPYLAISLDTQFQEGFAPKTRQPVSKFANPLHLSQGAGIAKNLLNHKNFNITTRLGFGAKEVIVSDDRFSKLWTGDEAKWMKTDGGFEWLTESKSQFNSTIQWSNSLKFFQAIFSSISQEKDPDKNWRKTDVHWEQMLTAKMSQYIVFNVIMKFIYDCDTSKGGQFLENTSLGISYKFD